MAEQSKPFKRKDVQPCIACSNGVMHDNNMTFYRLQLEHMVVNVGAIQRRHGLEIMMGHVALASVFSTDEDLAAAASNDAVLVCFDCAMKYPLVALQEMAAKKRG